MRTPDEQDRLVDALTMTVEVMGQEISQNTLIQMVLDLEEYTEAQIAFALRACRHEIKGKLTLKDIIDRIDDGRPPREEAWSIALSSLDERETVAWTREISEAMASCSALMESRDKVAARMAFLQAYDRLVLEARRLKRPTEWSLSIGQDVDRRLVCLEDSVRLGRLTQKQLAGYSRVALPAPEPETADGQAIAGLLTGPARGGLPSEEVRRRLEEIRKSIKATRSSGGEITEEYVDRLAEHQKMVVPISNEAVAEIAEAIAESSGGGHTDGN